MRRWLGDDEDQAGGAPPAARSFLGKLWGRIKWVARQPFRAFPRREVERGGQLIRALASGKAGEGRRRLYINADRTIDWEATAFWHGVTVYELERLSQRRRRETARMAYILFGIGWAAFLGWVHQAATLSWTPGRVLALLEFAPFCLIFILCAFQSALQNFRLRTGRMATPWEYLLTDEAFWPR